jgi:hypothetical protein
VYGFTAASGADGGAISTVLVMMCLTLVVAIIGGAGVSFAVATAAFATARSSLWTILAGAGGGLAVGAFGKLLGLDAFDLLLGRAPVGITGGMEGLVVGASVGVGAVLADRGTSIRYIAAAAALSGTVGGCVIVLLGGRLMLGSLAVLARVFPGSRLHVEQFWRLFGEASFGPIAQFTIAALECGLFSGFVVTAMAIGRLRTSERR